MIKSFKDLEIWKLGIDLAIEVYRVSSKFPKEELYGLVSQMKRAAVSVPSNIAEGRSRSGNKQFKQYLLIAKGSLSELLTQMIISEKLHFIDAKDFGEISTQIDILGKKISSLINAIERQKVD